MKKPAWQLAALLMFLCLSVPSRAGPPVTITVDARSAGPRINPRMYGVFLEEINHGVDGGLYAELIRNRGFEDSRPPEGYTLHDGHWLDPGGADAGFSEFGYSTDQIPFWTLVQEGDAHGTMQLEVAGGVTDESPNCLRLDVADLSNGRVGVANQGFFGIGVTQGDNYELSLYARSDNLHGPLIIQLEDAAGSTLSNQVRFDEISSDWKLFRAKLTATKTDAKSRFVVSLGASGRLWLDFASLFPEKTWKNRGNGLRADIAKMVADLKPGFVRFPGGCVVEGGTVETAYNWKLTVGPLEKRQERWGPWNYRRTQGMGLHEYLQFCEDLGAEPLWVGFCGQTCIFRQREHVPMAEMGWVRDNFLDLVEYANGPADSKWGSLRAGAGHPVPFGLKLIEIGNENQGREFRERYDFVHEALKSKYPDVKYLADLSFSGPAMHDAARDIEDRHFYNAIRWFESRFHEFDDRGRDQPPLYLGELAVTSDDAGPLRGNLSAALAEGVFLMGCERNADTVRMVSYAPLLGHIDGRTGLAGSPPPWHGMIYFDGSRVFGTASYYLWKLFGTNRPDQMVEVRMERPEAKPFAIAGQIGIGTWDATADFKDVRVERDGKVVEAVDFANGAADWENEGGEWSTREKAYTQGRRGFGLSYFGSPDWSDYILTLKARKSSGGEGFLIVFGRRGTEKYWWNLGGWGNQQHAIELNQNIIGRQVRGTIESNRWYDIKIELTGDHIRCYLDGELIHDVSSSPPERFFVTAGRDETRGELVLKAINIAEEPQPATIQLRGMGHVEPAGQLTVLTSGRQTDNNSLDSPEQVVPAASQISAAGPEFAHEFPPRSLTILRLKESRN